MSASRFSPYATPGYMFLDDMACEYWPTRSTALSTLSSPDLVNVEEPATVRDIQMTLPSMGRAQNFEKLSSFVRDAFNAWKEGHSLQHPPSLFVCGAPGTGKTYFCRMGILGFLNKDGHMGNGDPFNMACAISAQKQLHLELSFSDGLVGGETANPSKSLGFRIIYEMFKDLANFRRRYPTSHEFLSAFMSGPTSSAHVVTLSDVGTFLKTRLSLPEGPTILFVHLDEIERILQRPDKKEGVVYLQSIAEAFDAVNLEQYDVFFCPLFSGTGSTPIVEALKARGHYRGGAFVIDLDLITPKEYCQGLSDFLSMQIGYGSKPPPFKASEISKGVQGTLMDIEGVPKLFIALLHVLSYLKGPQSISPSSGQFLDWPIDRQRIREAVKDPSLSTSTILKALYTCITGFEYPSLLDRKFGVTPLPTFPSGATNGSTFEMKIPRPFLIWIPFEHRVTFPFILLKSILPREHLNIVPTEETGPLYWREIADFDGTWLLCRLKAFKDLRRTSQPLQDFLPMDASCRQAHRLINLSGPIDDSLERLETKPHDMVSRCRRLGKIGCFGWKNVLGAGGWDWALSLPLVDAGRLLLVGERMEGSLHPSRIEAELKTVTATWFRTGMRVGHFVVLTDGVFEGTLSANVKKMTSIVDRTTMDKFFGKIMAARLRAASELRAFV
ncbi:uncharacterized protein EV420DRAFT_1647957 [Desarmillaria tabescens]|uniref:Uncharacterized protein n=1 Tax=Armillaria tabescens TaxID=1929756 RepID=A0AA39MUI1_ARMTA|nr:uncharacterized protein EV420DRAFT_1647957 [Desarmillaria tabescens]KAK0446524.1 hypothetical protein EV420DRAFT_1647957 [Desarmillaria tabescens]